MCIRGLILGFLILLAFAGRTQDLDYRAQSLYIYKFTKFIYWPEDRTEGDFNIGVFGNSPILDELNLMASLKKAAEDQPITVREITADEDLSDYHIVYVPASKSRQIRTLAEKIGDQPVLIVAEREGMASRGATISFFVTDVDILKFEVNVRRLEQQKMTISDDLVKLGFKL
jgi:hypothetical protein